MGNRIVYRVLSRLIDVRPGEAYSSLLLFIYFFLIIFFLLIFFRCIFFWWREDAFNMWSTQINTHINVFYIPKKLNSISIIRSCANGI